MENTTTKLLMIFYRNPEMGQVKTRLAATLGDAAALAIYLKLVSHTRIITDGLNAEKIVYYSNYIDTEDSWPNHTYKKALQQGEDLGARMQHAFQSAFHNGYQKVCIIGTDCLELSKEVVENAFAQLNHNDAVLGPAKDGGYYLLGLKKYIPDVFTNKVWSTDTVAIRTLDDFKNHQLTYTLLPELRDVDTEADLPPEVIKPFRLL
jgi:uncharacterized protein